jgi:Tfp pilus assembly protein PilX
LRCGSDCSDAIQLTARRKQCRAMLITILVVLIILALALYAIQLAPLDGRITILIQIVAIIIAIVVIVRAAGLG